MTESKYAPILRALADGKTVQWQNAHGKKEWESGGLDEILRCMQNCIDPERLRIRPATITITISGNGGSWEVPEPLRVAPEYETSYYSPDLTSESLVFQLRWCDDSTDRALLKKGHAHATAEGALAHAKALILASGGSV